MVDPIERHKCCPQCGSKRYKFADSMTKLAPHGVAAALPIRDRICKECGRLYHPEVPTIIPYTLVGIGAVLVLFGIMAFFGPLMSGPVRFQWWVKFLLIAAGGGTIFAGLQLIGKKR